MSGSAEQEAVNPVSNHKQGIQIRPAASLIIVRDGESGVEVLALKRSLEMRFLPGYIAFPGGGVSELDDKVTPSYFDGCLEAQHHTHDRTFAVAALRECAEEIGWVCCLKDDRGEMQDRLVDAAQQRTLLGSDAAYGDLLQGTLIDGTKLRFVGRWVTPKGMPARFDTRFFLYITNASNLQPRIHQSEVEWARWVNPSDQLALIQSGHEQAVQPTRAILKALAGMKDTCTCWKLLSVPGPQPEM